MFKAGYKFKESHSEIHFLRKDHGRLGSQYSRNFTKDAAEARIFDTEKNAEVKIMHMMSKFERDDDYRWTPVILNMNTGGVRMIISSLWH